MARASNTIQTKDVSPQEEAAAWNGYVRAYFASGLTRQCFCDDNPIAIGGQLYKVEPWQLRHAIDRLKKHGAANNYNRRRHNPGRPFRLPPRIVDFVLGNYILDQSLPVTTHRELLIEALSERPEFTQADLAGNSIPSYDRFQTLIRKLPEYFEALVEGGYKELFERLGPSEPTQIHTPGRVWVMDTATLTRYKFRVGKNELSPQVTFILDSGSRLCVGALLHWETAKARNILQLLQQAILPGKRDWTPGLWPSQGCPKVLLTDNAKLFSNKFLERACDRLGIVKRYAGVEKPNSNAIAERWVKILKSGFLPFLEQKIGAGFQGDGEDSSPRYTMFCKQFAAILERYNQTPKDLHDGLTPIEYFEQYQPRQLINFRPTEEVVEATRVWFEPKIRRGRFKYLDHTYFIKHSPLFTSGKILAWADSLELWPEFIRIECDGKVVGHATWKRNKAADDIFDDKQTVDEAAKAGDTFCKSVGITPITERKIVKKWKNKGPNQAMPHQPLAGRRKSKPAVKPKTHGQKNEPTSKAKGPIEFLSWAQPQQKPNTPHSGLERAA